jgi:hypothetical protein
MLVLIEGPDGAGKTTLANAVLDSIAGSGQPVAYMHASAPRRHPLIEYTEPLSEYQPGDGTSYVLDRWHIGETIYGPRYRGRCGLTAHQYAAVEDFLLEKGAVLVYCSGRLDDLVRRIRNRGEAFDLHAVKQLRIEAATWDLKIRTNTRLPVLHSPIGMEITVDEIIKFARERERGVARTAAA